MGRVNAARKDQPPLARLFAIAYRQLIDGLHERLRERGWSDVRPAFGFVLLAVREQPVSGSELAAFMGTTKQAASKLIDTMEACGYVKRGTADDGRQRPVQLTARGVKLLRSVEHIYTELDQEWVNALGASGVEQLRNALIRVLAGEGGMLPPVRPTW